MLIYVRTRDQGADMKNFFRAVVTVWKSIHYGYVPGSVFGS